jgi:hypothetical protein
MRDVGHAAGGADLHADAVEGSLCDIREFRSKGGEDCRTGIEQQDAQRGRVDLAKVPLQGTVRKLGDLTGHLNARRAGADDHERQPFSSSVGSSSNSAISKAPKMRARSSSASSTVFKPGANVAYSSWPKYEPEEPVATMSESYSSSTAGPIGRAAVTRRFSRSNAVTSRAEW